MSDALKRTLRTVLQLVISGTLTVVVDAVAGGLAPETAAVVLAVWQVVVTLAQNAVEDATGKSVLK